MAKKQDRLPDDVFATYNNLRTRGGLNQTEIGLELKRMFPLLSAAKGKNVVQFIKHQAADYNIELAKGPIGGSKPNLPAADDRWLEQTPELVIPYSDSVLIMSDVHAGSRSNAAVEKALDVIRHKSIRTVVFNGDLLDNAYKGHHGLRTKWAQPYQEGCEAAQGIVQAVADCDSVTHIVFLCGNHDDKAFRDTDREHEFDAHMKLDVLSHLSYWNDAGPGKGGHFNKSNLDHGYRHIKVDITNRYYALMGPQHPKPWPWDGPENFPTIFTHQMEYGRAQLGVAKRLVDTEFANTYCGHQHHLAVGKHISGMVYTVDCGTLQDPNLPAYKNARQTTHPKWSVGFVTILHGVPEIWAMSYSPEWWESRLS